MTETPFLIERLTLPDSLESPEAGDFLELCALTDTLLEQVRGNTDLGTPDAARLQNWRDSDYQSLEIYFIRAGGRMAARAWIQFPLRENLETAWIGLGVLREFEGRGLGRALADHVEARAAARGRTVLQSGTEHTAGGPDDGGERLVPPTGSGSVPASSRAVRFALRRGYELVQVERTSLLTLSEGTVRAAAELQAAAQTRAGDAYELVSWLDATPERYLEDLVTLYTSMSTEIPLGGLELGEELFDAARVREIDDRREHGGVRAVTMAARHRQTGALAGYSILEHSEERPEVAHQDNTIVLPGHRGHALGQWMKAANLFALTSAFPAVRRIYTYNADENRHMLDINVAMGFVPAGHDGQWQRKGPWSPEGEGGS
ncbi:MULTISPECIES: GNAT family N-acetyltransferase [Arthrobacter]|uniref:GNAT family N-acetyltransferase n=2 Tax=Arthrobacter TaxID=1663 RepID=A0ABU9KMX9_9MICC|nr:GNAT family N-acetyltransferase [Arthrobacter sp. YJM1]MDP5228103.1 GNAT family N-acetyltransferase [Arthrobacter sp. YJM1]